MDNIYKKLSASDAWTPSFSLFFFSLSLSLSLSFSSSLVYSFFLPPSCRCWLPPPTTATAAAAATATATVACRRPAANRLRSNSASRCFEFLHFWKIQDFVLLLKRPDIFHFDFFKNTLFFNYCISEFWICDCRFLGGGEPSSRRGGGTKS